MVGWREIADSDQISHFSLWNDELIDNWKWPACLDQFVTFSLRKIIGDWNGLAWLDPLAVLVSNEYLLDN